MQEYYIAYVWEDRDALAAIGETEMKFGDHFLEAATLEKAFEHTERYIRGSLARQKHKFDEERVVIHHMWDVTEYAKRKGRFGRHKKIDDVIRPCIGHHVQADVHRIEADKLIERVNLELSRHGQLLPEAGLSQNQYDAARNVIDAMQKGKRTVVAELCARFGKTIWSGALIRETDAQLTIVASYVLTSFTSFKKDLTSFEQFRDLQIIEAGDDGWENDVASAIVGKKQCVVLLSMCQGSRRQDKINFLFGLDVKRLVIVDEADFGVHQVKQSKPLIEARGSDDTVILMTGTNGDKAASVWPVDHYLSVTYPELLMEKKLSTSRGGHEKSKKVTHRSSGFRAHPNERRQVMLTYFKVDPKRHELVAEVQFYQMGLTSVVERARSEEPDAFVEDGIFLPSWSKFAARPVRAKGFFTNVLQAVFEGKGGDDSLNIDMQTKRRAAEGTRVAMMFLPGSTTNANMEEIVGIAKNALQGFSIVPVYGGVKMTNANAEREVKESIEKAKQRGQSVLILSAGMAQRSFSIPEITELFLAYDAGDQGATIQKMSRALTPARKEKVGRIISLSFDPNRDDKFDAMIVETAQNFKRNRGMSNLKPALREVIKTVDLFKCQPDGAVKMQLDEYLEDMLDRNSIDRIIGKVAHVTDLTATMIKALAAGDTRSLRAARVEAAQKGKTSLNVAKKRNGENKTDASERDLKKVREMIVMIAQNIDVIFYYSGESIEKSFDMMDSDGREIQSDVADQFGVPYDMIKELVLGGFINRDLLDLKFL